MRRACLLFVASLAVAFTMPAPGDGQQPALAADIVLINGKIWTVNKAQPETEAIAIRGERIVAVGRDADVKPLIGPKTRVIDLGRKRVLPGFHDSHVHLLSSGLRLRQVALKDAADEAEFGKRLVAFDRKLPPGRWMLGGNW